jgi:hypothetical protein
MKNKIIIMALAALLFLPAAAFSDTGLGAAFTYGLDNGDHNTGAALSVNTPAIPGTVQNLSLKFSTDYFSFSVSDDWWVIQETLTGALDFYVGLGFYAGMSVIDNGDPDFALGGRAPIGLSIKPIDFAEFFLEVAPAMGLGFEPEIHFPSWYVQGALGFRLWF